MIQQIDTLIRQLNLDELKNAYWIYAGNRYQALSVDQIDQSHLREQIALLSQCRQNPAKLDQFQKLLTEVVSQHGIPLSGHQSNLPH